jgi:hypothetical protein
MSAENNVPEAQPPKKKRWVPKQIAWSIRSHMFSMHKGSPINEHGVIVGPSQHDHEAWDKLHEQAHANGEFKDGHDHEHFTPKKGK